MMRHIHVTISLMQMSKFQLMHIKHPLKILTSLSALLEIKRVPFTFYVKTLASALKETGHWNECS